MTRTRSSGAVRIARARIRFEGWRGSPERASEISRGALRQLAEGLPAAGAAAPHIQLTVRVPHGASDAAIAGRVAEALGRHFRGTGT